MRHSYILQKSLHVKIDIEVLEELLSLGRLSIQYCVRSKKA